MDPALAIEVAASHRAEAVNSAISRGDSDIQRFYKNSVVFLTGGSGFLGKQLTDKLLRSSEISKIYFLMRAKKGKDTERRLDDVLSDPVFNSLRLLNPDFYRKIIPVAGDVAEIKLGIKDEDWQTITQEVTVIFHVAATTRFDETLRTATLINVRGTREALALGKACTNLKSYVHVSTAYSYATISTIGKKIPEQFFKSPISPQSLISMVEEMQEERLVGLTPKLIADWPNSYTFTKAVAEELIRTTSAGLPICIIRPGIVLSTYSEPVPGWLDMSCLYGATGFLIGCGVGVVHIALANFTCTLGFIPCDTVNNAIIAAAKEVATNKPKDGNQIKIYNVSSTKRNPVTWTQVYDIFIENRSKITSPKIVYYPFLICTDIKLVYTLLSLFFHVMPAYIADAVCLLRGIQPRFAKFVRKMSNMNEILSYFLINQWTFEDDNLSKLYNKLSDIDKTIFNFDIPRVNFLEYLPIWCMGARKYIIKDGLEGTFEAQRKMKFLKILNYFVLPLYVYFLWKIFCLFYFIVNSVISNVVSFI